MEAIGFIAFTVGAMSATIFAIFGSLWLMVHL